ncbi:sulfite exporter TauE/SafE family protein [Pseudomonas stutzeri]|uniref:sulfite exporter TauE/SafE family protein n=1 Tax=Stutzerimonas stutzeri TaxID=316 RepID=UPI001F481A1F|nr:sulfite exporter TauE/SafE family protein [Stutzerimonas stutzeri]MCF0013875.1 sulfite exporter TauE/SafE family protein [Stutzerimonas stutzeri]MCF0019643.1 sulfite exporter TauE/SafE family protein [Stutzerimonas stutzeri]MDH0100043.1 sulfite exporter TauE/SafE family protein [Stutzerimonas stutzeri]
MDHSIATWAILLAAAFLGGGLNAIAGGGSFFTFPALVYAGVPPVAANASGTFALLPGYFASTWGYREDLQAPATLSMRSLLAVSLGGGAFGAALLLTTPDDVFRAIVPWLLLVATLLFAFGPWLLRTFKRTAGSGEAGTWVQACAIAAVSVYGGYFNGGLGIVLLAAFSLLGHSNINAMQGLKNLVSSVLTAIAVSVYAFGGAIFWREALVMMLAATVGGYVMARVGRRLPATLVRAVVIVTGSIMTILFFRS